MIARWLLRQVGRFHEVRNPAAVGYPSSPLPGNDAPEQEETARRLKSRWELNRLRLVPGWYMLEIEHSVKSIGCVLTLEGEGGLQEHLLLTSKPVCKRIVRLESGMRRCTISIDQPDCSLSRVVLTGLSAGFAVSRIRNRLAHRGRTECTESSEVSVLYAAYQSHVHDAVFPRAYVPDAWPVVAESGQVAQGCIGDKQSELLLLLMPADNAEPVHESTLEAVDFARRCGWEVLWQPFSSQSPDTGTLYPDRRVFRLPVPPGVRCRLDIFHQLLGAVEDNSVLVYADHDHVDTEGSRSEPVLKPEWNPELLLNRNYIDFPWMVSEGWAQCLGIPDCSWQQTHDLILLAAALGVCEAPPSSRTVEDATVGTRESRMATPPLSDHQVVRIPDMLCSRELTSQVEQRAGAPDPWRQGIEQALARAGSTARVEAGVCSDISHVIWPLPASLPDVDIIIPTRDKVDVLRTCIDSVLEKTQYENYRIVVVDNDSQEPQTEDYYQDLLRNPRIELLRFPGEFNYSAINNHAVARGHSELVVLLNNDTEVLCSDWLGELVRQAMRPETGCVGAKLFYTNGRIQHGGVIVGVTGVAGHAHRYSPGAAAGYCGRLLCSQNLTAVTAACLAIRRETYELVGGLDEDGLGVAWNDVDLCLKVRQAGYRNLWTPHAQLYHHEGLSRGADSTRTQIRRVDAERSIMMERWALDTFSDPAYHPLLARDNESFALGKAVD